MAYLYTMAELQRMERADRIAVYVNFALAERVEALVLELARMNDNLEVLAQVNSKLDALVEATKTKKEAP